MALLFQYSRWDGTQEVFPLDEDALMDELSEQLLNHGDVNTALRNMMRRGLQGFEGRTKGLQDLMEQLQQRRQESLDRYDLSSALDDIRQRLESILQHEDEGIQRQLDRARDTRDKSGQAQDSALDRETIDKLLADMERRAAASRERLAEVPKDDPAQAIEKLRDYEFTDPRAKEEFDELMQMLQQKVADSFFKDLMHGLQNTSPEQLQALKQMARDLNEMMEQKLRGEEADFQRFMEEYGSMFGADPPKDLDELIERMQRSMGQMQSLVDSLSPENRRELQGLIQSAFGDAEFQRQLERLAAHLESLDPMSGVRKEYPFAGEEQLDLSDALDLMEELQKMDRLDSQLRKAQQGGSLGEIDPSTLEEVMGEDARRALEQLASIAHALEEAGYLKKVGSRFELTPKGMRKIGHRALKEIFAYIKKDRIGSHQTDRSGQGLEYADATKTYEFGDPFLPHLPRTIMNAVMRDSNGVPVKIHADDFEIYQTEQTAQAATVLMLDLSLSMAMRGNFMAAKKVALALDNLMRTQFPRDKLFIVGFSTYAREIKPESLAQMGWDEFDPYTNIQHGLLISQKLLSRVKGGTKQIIMISDGEPTAHMEAGQVFLQYPPSPRTIRQTLAEVRRCTKQSITINTFMLDRNSYLVDFVEQLTRLNRGRLFYTTPERLGQYILVDYLKDRKRKIVV